MTSPKPLFIVQDAIARGCDAEAAAAACGGGLQTVPDGPRTAREAALHAADARATFEGFKPIAFVALPVAGRIARQHAVLARGLCAPYAALTASVLTTSLPPELLLNPQGIWMPWAHLGASRDLLAAALGCDAVFIRPDSATKPFAGFSTSLDTLAREVAARDQTDRVDPAELVFCAPARPQPRLEWRFWVVMGEIVAHAPYDPVAGAIADSSDRPALDGAIRTVAERAVAAFALREDSLVVDIAETPEGPKVVEFNALSTSGWYPGLDLRALLAAMDDLFV